MLSNNSELNTQNQSGRKLLHKAHILISHAFIRGEGREMDAVLAISPYVDIMIDSGAFTNFQIKMGKLKYSTEIPFEEYLNTCKKYYHGRVWQYVAFDVIRNSKATQDNLLKMLDAGLMPMPVLTPTEDIDEVHKLLELCPHRRVSISGMTQANEIDRTAGRIQKVYSATKGKALIHGLGFMRYPMVFQVPVATIDASSMTTGSRFGTVSLYSKEKGIQLLHWKDLEKKERANYLWELLKMGLSIDELKKPENYRTSKGIQSLSTVASYIEFAQHCEEKNIGLFAALPNSDWILVLAATYYVMSLNGGKLHYKEAANIVNTLRETKKSNSDKFCQMLTDIFEKSTSHHIKILNDEQDITKRFPIK